MPAITKPSNHFNATLYTGTGTNAVGITGVGFQTDFNWTKSRSSSSYTHQLSDSVRGFSKYLYSSATSIEGTDASNHIQSVNSDGYVINSGASFNASTVTYVSWNWKAGGTAVTNTSGTLTSQVSVNATAGFSVVTYTGTVSYPQTIGHGLGAVPQFIMVKNRSRIANWAVYHASVGNTKALYLNATDAAYADGGFWNNTSPTSTVFTGDNGVGYTTNGATDNYVAYCWTPIAGYSAFGSYTGNGSTDGPFVYTGFRPAFLIIKCSSSSGSGANQWMIVDNKRNTFNVENNTLKADLTDAEGVASLDVCDFLSNGFKIRNTNGRTNTSSETYVYAAYAEAPFKYASAR